MDRRVIRPLLHPLFLLSASLYLLLFVLKKLEYRVPGLSEYGADVLAMPVVLTLSLVGIRASKASRRNWRFTWLHILFGILYFAFLFEWLFPRIDDRTTADPWDVLAYAVGGLLFGLLMNDRVSGTEG